MNTANVTLKPTIQEFNEALHALELLYFFGEIDILPMDDSLGVSPHMLQMVTHIWQRVLQLGLELELAAGNYTDANGVTVVLEERYVLDHLIPEGIVPNNQVALASVVDVDGFLSLVDPLKDVYVYHSFRALYHAKSQSKDPVPPMHIKVPGAGISPYSDGGWFVPPLYPGDFDQGSLLLGIETHTPAASGYEDWSNDGGAMFMIFHPCLTNALLRSNLPEIGFGTAPEAIWTHKLLSTNDDYPACVPPYTILSDDMNAHFLQIFAEYLGFPVESITPNHERGAWASYDWTSAISQYYWSHSNHGIGCPLACDLCYKNQAGFGEDAVLIRREWVLGSYGRPGTPNRDLYAHVLSVPEEYFPGYEKYLFLNGKSLDLVSTSATIQAEWDATGQNIVQYSHYGGLAGDVRYPDMIILDRAHYLLSSVGVTGGAFSASPINYIRNYRHEGDQRDGVLYLLGAVIPDDYTVYYRPAPGQPSGGLPVHTLPILKDMLKGDLKVGHQDDILKHTLMYNGETLEYNGEELVYL